MFCKYCGEEIRDEAVVCPKCGCPVESKKTVTATGSSSKDAPNTGMAVLGFFIPLIGLILWAMWKDQTPLKARSAGKGALIGFIVGIVSSVILGIFSAVILDRVF